MFTEREQHELRKMLDERQIYKVLIAYCRAMDRADREGLLKVYHPGAIEDHGPFKGPADEFVAFALKSIAGSEPGWPPIRWQAHHICNVLIEFSDDQTAKVESSFIYGYRLDDDEEQDTYFFARYLDVFKKRPDWRIQDRRVVLDNLFDMASSTRDDEFRRSFLKGSKGKADPLYAFLSQEEQD